MQTFMIKNNILLDQISELSNGQNKRTNDEKDRLS